MLTAARILFSSGGFQRVSTDESEKVPAISKAMLYLHFGGIVDLFRAIIEAEVDNLDWGMSGEVSKPLDFVSALEAFGANRLQVLNQPEINCVCS